MPTHSQYSGSPTGSDTNPTPSPCLWNQVDAELEHPGLWLHKYNVMGDLPYNTEAVPTTVDPWHGMEVFTSSGATLAQLDEDGAPRAMVEATDNEGLSINQGIYPYKIIQNAGELVFEARVKRDEITGTWGFFVGLIESITPTATVPITATTTILSDNNLVGFHNEEADPDGVNTTYKANGIAVVEVETDVHTLVADTWVKLGMVFNRNGDNVLAFYVDGNKQATTKLIPSAAGTDFPNDVRMGWVVANLNGAGAAMQLGFDWIRVAQKRTLGVL